MREKFAKEIHLWFITFIITKEKHTQKEGLTSKLFMFWWVWFFHPKYWAQENVNCLHCFIYPCWFDIDLTLSQRPYEIHSATPIDEILNMFKIERVHYSSAWCKGMTALLKKVRKHKHLLSLLLSSSRSPSNNTEASGKHTLSWSKFRE